MLEYIFANVNIEFEVVNIKDNSAAVKVCIREKGGIKRKLESYSAMEVISGDVINLETTVVRFFPVSKNYPVDVRN
jgi:hypothetical protein